MADSKFPDNLRRGLSRLVHESTPATRRDAGDILHASSYPSVLIRDERIIDANAAALELFGCARSALIGQVLGDVVVDLTVDGKRVTAEWPLWERTRPGFPLVVAGRCVVAAECCNVELIVSRLGLTDDELLFGVARTTEEAASTQHDRDFHALLLSISNRFTVVTENDVELRMRESMQQICSLFRADRMSMWWLDPEREVARDVLQVGVDAKPGSELVGPFSRLQWVIDRIYARDGEAIDYPNDVPSDRESIARYFEEFSVKSCLIIPTTFKHGVVGVAGVSSLFETRSWSKRERVELTLLCRTLGKSWIMHRTERERRERERYLKKRIVFQSRLAKISSDFATSRGDDVQQTIDQALMQMADSYGFDRASLWQLDLENDRGYRLHEWAMQVKFRLQEAQVRLSDFVPWITARLKNMQAGAPIAIPDDLPEDSVDLAYYRSRGVKNGLVLPIVIEGKLEALFGLSALEARTWDERELTELTLLTHTISSAWLRRSSRKEIREREIDLSWSQRVAAVGSFSVHSADGAPLNARNATIRISAEASRLFDIAPGEETLAKMLQRIHPEDRRRVYRHRSKSVDGKSGMTLDYRVVWSNGMIVHIEDRAEVDRGEDGRVVRLFGTYQDVTERIKAQEDLQRAVREIELLKDRLQAENVVLREEVRVAKSFQGIVGDSKSLRSALAAAQQAAPTGVTVLILGETGTGKELVARAIHEQSNRRSAPLISVNCAALSADLIESELFGHEVGAFTGANQQRQGRFELAHRGTLFLDEIGDLPLTVQAKLLRVLQTGEFQRLGGSETLHADVRVIAATNRDLAAMIESKSFRADLYFRINSFPVELPPLRERREDIPALASHFVDKHAAKLGKDIRSISAAMLEYMAKQSWPGNVRELEGYVQRALISSSGRVLHHLEPDRGSVQVTGLALQASPPVLSELPEPPADDADDADDLRSMQRRHIRDVLNKCNWVISGTNGAAAALGIPPSSLRSRMKRFGIHRDDSA